MNVASPCVAAPPHAAEDTRWVGAPAASKMSLGLSRLASVATVPLTNVTLRQKALTAESDQETPSTDLQPGGGSGGGQGR